MTGIYLLDGMHMNNLGKERIALEMANEATKILSKQAKVISLQWKDNSTSDDNLEEISPLQDDLKCGNDTMTIDQDKTTPVEHEQTEAATQGETTDSRTSGRKRKQPVTRGSDFLWLTDSRPRT